MWLICFECRCHSSVISLGLFNKNSFIILFSPGKTESAGHAPTDRQPHLETSEHIHVIAKPYRAFKYLAFSSDH